MSESTNRRIDESKSFAYSLIRLFAYSLIPICIGGMHASLPDRTPAVPSSSYVHLNRLFAGMNTRAPEPVPEALRPFVRDSVAIMLDTEHVRAFLEAAVEDSITLLRATALFTRWVKTRKIPVIASGESVSSAIGNRYMLGLTFPVDHIDYMFYLPDSGIGGHFQARIQVIYNRQYTYRFDEHIFNANVIVEGNGILYERDGVRHTGYLVTTDVYYNGQAIEYTNVSGISGQKRGALGLLQTVLFFVPRTLNGLTLADGDLIIDAFVNQTIQAFERQPRYRVRRAF